MPGTLVCILLWRKWTGIKTVPFGYKNKLYIVEMAIKSLEQHTHRAGGLAEQQDGAWL